jgi:prophage antirepressor-like protein
MQYQFDYKVQVFEYENERTIRIVEIDDEVWFVLADVCLALGLQSKDGSYAHHAERLDDDERQVVSGELVRKHNPNNDRRAAPNLTVVSESGLYALILRSRRPDARHFRKWITSEVLPSIRRTGSYGQGNATAFIQRYNQNWDRIEPGYFSVINELVWWLWGRLAHVGHVMADRGPDGRELRPDVSVGRLFAAWLRDKHPERAEAYKTYLHTTPETEIEARQYPDILLPMFRRFVDTVWIPAHSQEYFRTRDPEALLYLPHLLPGSRPTQIPSRPAFAFPRLPERRVNTSRCDSGR